MIYSLNDIQFITAQPGSLSTSGEPTEPAPPSSIPSASPVQPQVQASRQFENRAPQRAASPGRKHSNRTDAEGDHLESEDDQEAFDYQRHRGGGAAPARNGPRKGAEASATPSGTNGHASGTGSPLTHAALENWNKGPGGSSGGDVARWQGQGSVPGKPPGQGPPAARREDEEEQATSPEAGANTGQDKQREWCLCRRPDSWGDMIRCDKPTCAIQWVSESLLSLMRFLIKCIQYHIRCVGLDLNQVRPKDEWICEDCNRKAAQRRQEAHRDGPPPPLKEKDRTPIPRSSVEQAPPPAPAQSQAPQQPNPSSRPESRDQSHREQDGDVVMRPADQGDRKPRDAEAASDASDDEHVRAGASGVPRKINVRRVLSESQSPKPTAEPRQGGPDAREAPPDARSEPPSARAPPVPLPGDSVRRSEPPDQESSTPRKKGWKGYALVPVPDANEATLRSEHAAQVVITPGGTRRTRSGKTFAEDGVSASDGMSASERQQSTETN